MTLGQLKIFVTFLREKSISATAVRLGLTSSAVSHSLNSLEKSLGVLLLDREKTPVVVTKIGQRVSMLAKEVVSLTTQIQTESAAVKGATQGILRIGSCGPSASLKLLPPVISRFKKRYPEVIITVIEAADHEVLSSLVERRIDIACIVLPDARFDTLQLAEDRLVVALPCNHPLVQQETVLVNDLAQEILLLTDAGSEPLIEQAFLRAGVKMNVGHRFSQIVTMLDWVARNEGIVVMAELAVPHYVPNIVIRPLMPICHRPLGLAVRTIYEAPDFVRAFWAIAEEYFRPSA